jgi:hypothetical protein
MFGFFSAFKKQLADTNKDNKGIKKRAGAREEHQGLRINLLQYEYVRKG